MAHKIQHRRDSAANWSSVDPILSEGEIGFDLTNKIFKVGDGISNWSTLPTYDSALAEHAVNFHSDVDGWANTNPLMDGVAAQGSSNRIARQDHVHPTDTSREPANANIQSHISSTENPHSVTTTQIGAEPAFSKNTAFNKNFGSTTGTVCQGDDARLSDARTPTSHDLAFHSDTGGFSNANPLMNGAASQGTSDRISRQDHVHPTDTSREPANANIQSHISSTSNPHSVSIAQIGAEPANANIQSHISSTSNPHSVTTTQIGAVAANTAITGGTHTKITYDSKGLITAGTNISASDVPALDASKISTGVFDIARIPAAALERMVPVANQTARFALTTNEVQLGDTVKQLDTGIMYVVIDTANLANAAGYAEYTAATAAAVPWSGVTSKPTTLSGYGITDAAISTHIHGNISNTGAIGSTSGLPIITTTSGVMTTGSFGASAGTFCQGNDSRLSDARTPTAHVLNSASHTVSGLTTGHFLKATGATTFGFAAHGLTYTDVGAAASSHTHLYAGSSSAGGAANSVANTLTRGTGLTGSNYNGSAATTWAVSYGTAAGTACQGNDSRLSDARTPTAHTHGNITNTGYIGSTAGLPIVTSTSGIVAAGSWYASTPAAPTTTGGTGSSTSPARGDHAHPSRIATSAPASPVNGDIWMV